MAKPEPLDWELVDKAAEELGVTEFARKKWRQHNRGVPAKWWMPIHRKTRGRVSIEALESSKMGAAA